MRIPISLVLLASVIGLGLVIVAGQLIVDPNLPLIASAEMSLETITPNADGDDDITLFSYSLSRNAVVSIVFEAEDGTQYYFREDKARSAGDYQVFFSGVVDGYILAEEEVVGTVERRLIPDGTYTWQLVAQESDGAMDEVTGTLIVENADVPLPIMSIFTVGPTVFTPNQDSIDDRVEINIELQKDVETLEVFLLGENNEKIPISARREGREPGEAGRHTFDYEGGIDLGKDPPPDGTYQVVAVAQDAEGQRMRRESMLTIQDGGKPFAEIVSQTVGVDVVFEVHPYDDRYYSTRNELGEVIDIPNNPDSLAFSSITMPVGEMLVFKLTIENYGDTPIRTTGPPPGTVYQQEQQAATLGWFDESGAWRVGIECQTSTTSFPYRWALGSDDILELVEHPDTGNILRYLPADEQVIVWGAIRLTEIEARNPQDCWAGLIHEDVEVSVRNNNVGRRSVELVGAER